MAYANDFDTEDLNEIVVDGIGTAGVAVKDMMPLLILAFILVALTGVAVAIVAKFR